MKKLGLFFWGIVFCERLFGATLYVDLNSTAPAAPFNSWASASTNIQAAVNAAATGDTILVTNGHYLLNAEIMVEKQVTIQSMNGPETTIVDGQGSVRCFNLGNTACVIEGLTITNGYSSGNGGGIYCDDTTPVVTNCTISGNSAKYGGGMWYGTANHCILSGNSASFSGGGMMNGTANHCILSGNLADSGGGMAVGTANHCTISGNTANFGGGMSLGTANHCILSGNTATYDGGGMYKGTANNCTISGNTASDYGGGMVDCTANNCTISGNTAEYGGGMVGVYLPVPATANNCIVWYNTAASWKDLGGTTARFSCSPDVTHGVDGNITNAPVLVSSSHIAADSPCRGAGSADYATGTDIDGEAWAHPPSMGCDEPSDDLPRGAIAVDFVANESMVASGYPIRFLEQSHGSLSAHVWDFGDGTRVTNSPFVEHAWAGAGTYDVVLTAYNADWPDGVSATQEVSIVSFEETAIHVSPNGNDANDGTSWASAKKTIQAGVDAQDFLGGGVLVGSGTYSLSATITVSKPVRIMGVDGPGSTIVDGQGKVCCFELGYNACVIGLTITNGHSTYGGGIRCFDSDATFVVTNCILSGNSATYGGGMYYGTANNCTFSDNSATDYGGGMSGGTANNCIFSGNYANSGGGVSEGTANNCTFNGNSADSGGGMSGNTANNCTFSGNSATDYGGGMSGGTANNCTFSGNNATDGGGMCYGAANNCIVWYNTAPSGKDLCDVTATYSCSPDVTHGVDGNITNAPVLVSSSHIAADSPCRGAGSADYATGTDIDGEAWANPPSMGCDEPSGGRPVGPMEVDFVANESMVASGYPIRFWEQIHGSLSAHVWDFGDGTEVTNSPFVEHAWAAAGTFDVVLTAYNADWPGGVSATQEVSIVSFEESAIHVSPNGNDAYDGTSWASAKKTIQAGVDAQNLLDGWVLVESGTYSLSATIRVSKPVRIVGVDGPGSTIVDGQGNVCCFYLGSIACVIEGLTITNGYSEAGGGIFCEGPIPVVTHCTISGNTATDVGGGMYFGTANNCTISGNSANRYGGGMYYGTANNCTISGNSASQSGGGIYDGTANNCILSGNSAEYGGGGMSGGTANNCTISGNSAGSGGGMRFGTANNSIIYYNNAVDGNDLRSTAAFYSCSPDVVHGVDGNITNAPMLVSTSHIAMDSPCIGAGNAEYATGTDIDGEAWLNPPSMGCDEYSEAVSGPVSVETDGVDKVLLGSAALLTAEVEGAVSLLIWDFDDGTVISNVLSLDYVWTQLGSYDVVLTAYNNTWPDGVSSTQTVEVLSAESAAVYVAVGGDDANDGLSWATAKATIQAGVDAQGIAEGWILVSNGTYAVTNEITVNKAVVIRGVNGPENTIIDGGGVARCLNLGNTACLVEGLTITNGFAGDSIGGGIYCIGILPVVTNCTISGNSAYSGGGINGGTANNCTISGNSATRFGGGMRQGTANNCILSGNSAKFGGGMSTGTANNCTISGNSAEFGAGMREGTANNCTISDNVSSSSGGGLDECTANYCTITGNTAVFGGGLDDRCTANYCTISDNSAESSGGGMNRSTANNCTISGNTAEYGGGMDGGTANNCVISGNTAGSYGGGMYEGTANNCTISGNTARLGAGIYGGGSSFAANNCTIIGNIGFGLYSGRTGNGTANNCIVWYNIQGDLTPNITARYSCSPDLIHGVDGNITNAPAFVDAANGDYRLLSTSPCINRGDNALVVGVVDLDGLPRIAGCFVDMGAYEFQGPFTADMDADDLPDEWERSYFTSGAEAPNGNADLDGLSNWGEYIAGTDPSDAASCLAITNCCQSDGFTVEWGPSMTGRLYRVVWSDSLTNSTPIVLQDNIEYPQSSYTDTEHNDQAAGFYRVEVRMEE